MLELLVLGNVYFCLSRLPVLSFDGWYCSNPLASRVIVTMDAEEKNSEEVNNG
jgi:hypothetical protein